MTDAKALYHTHPAVDPRRRSQTMVGSDFSTPHVGVKIKPLRYRYLLADIRTGEVIAELPLTAVSYSVGMYSGQEMTGTVYLPDLQLDLMQHQPSNAFLRKAHPDASGTAIGAMFECGNTAIYIIRNGEVVWGGILWSRSYSSGSKTMSITGLSWDGYIYYRALRQTTGWDKEVNPYKYWRVLLMNVLSDWSWPGDNGLIMHTGYIEDGIRQGGPTGTESFVTVPWTGITWNRMHAHAPARNYYEAWPNNNPNIEVPGPNLRWRKTSINGVPVEVMTYALNEFRGWDMNYLGPTLEQWADTNTLETERGLSKKTRFEYRVVCWFDNETQRFRQRYEFGEMLYENPDDPYEATAIVKGLIGRGRPYAADTVFDFPGHISEWSLNEGMEDSATRVIATSNADMQSKHAEYASDGNMIKRPRTVNPSDPDPAPIGSKGWLLYDRVYSTDNNDPEMLASRAQRILELCHVPVAAQINDIQNVNSDWGQRASQRSTDLAITLYVDPTVSFPEWHLGDWATFAIADPFYGGKMYLQRRIMGYHVEVLPDQEGFSSNERISLDLTDDTKIAESA